MINFTDITGLAGVALAIVALALQLPGVARLQRTHLAGFAALVAIAVLIPFGGLPLAAYVRGATGDLSIASLLLLALALKGRLGMGRATAAFRMPVLAFAVISALALYPMALGHGLFDPYRLGYGNPVLLAALLALTLLAWRRQLPALALAIALAVLAWGIGWYESANLWDYLVDPLLVIYAVGALLNQAIRSRSGQNRG